MLSLFQIGLDYLVVGLSRLAAGDNLMIRCRCRGFYPIRDGSKRCFHRGGYVCWNVQVEVEF
jgi:hypothetical protein